MDVIVFWVHTCTQIYQLQELGYLWCQTVLLKCWAIVRSACWGFWLWKYSKILNLDSSQFPFWGTVVNRFQEDINNELSGIWTWYPERPAGAFANHSRETKFKRDWGFPLILLKRALAYVVLLGFCLFKKCQARVTEVAAHFFRQLQWCPAKVACPAQIRTKIALMKSVSLFIMAWVVIFPDLHVCVLSPK